MSKPDKYLILPIAIIAIIIDQLSKVIVRINLTEYETINFIPGLINFTHTENTGAAFSLFSGQVEILTAISIIATIIIIVYLLLDRSQLNLIQLAGWGLLLGGTNGNLIDRLFFGSVTDFIDLAFIHFPIFNFADIFIDIGAVIIIIYSFVQVKNEKSITKSN